MSKLHRQRGFSLLEMLVVIAIIMILSAMAIVNLPNILRFTHVNAGYQTLLTQMRMARESAVAQRTIFYLTFNAPRSIVLTQRTAGADTVISTVPLPNDVSFTTVAGQPSTNATTPDNFGVGANAIDLDIGNNGGVINQIFFYPDGSARDNLGRIDNGVIYVGFPNDVQTLRAVSIYGATGRVRGWQLGRGAGGVFVWN